MDDLERRAAELAGQLLTSVGLSPRMGSFAPRHPGELARQSEIPASVAFARIPRPDREEDRRRIAQVALRLGRSPAELTALVAEELSRQYGLPVVNLGQLPVPDPAVLALLPAEVAHGYSVLPLSVVEHDLILATEDPGNLWLLDAVARFTGFRVDPVIAEVSDLEAAIRRAYPAKS